MPVTAGLYSPSIRGLWHLIFRSDLSRDPDTHEIQSRKPTTLHQPSTTSQAQLIKIFLFVRSNYSSDIGTS